MDKFVFASANQMASGRFIVSSQNDGAVFPQIWVLVPTIWRIVWFGERLFIISLSAGRAPTVTAVDVTLPKHYLWSCCCHVYIYIQCIDRNDKGGWIKNSECGIDMYIFVLVFLYSFRGFNKNNILQQQLLKAKWESTYVIITY